jgi:hypothetical protein
MNPWGRAAAGRAAQEAAMSMVDYGERARVADVSRPANTPAITLTLPDPRADDRRRRVELSRRQVVFRRTVGGVVMHLKVPISAFCGIALCVIETEQGEARYAVRLVHTDPEKCIQLVHGDAEAPMLEQWRGWLAFFGLPALLERELGRYEAAESLARFGALRCQTVRPRRRNAALANRRGRFGLRRKNGCLQRLTPVFAGEREIVCYE